MADALMTDRAATAGRASQRLKASRRRCADYRALDIWPDCAHAVLSRSKALKHRLAEFAARALNDRPMRRIGRSRRELSEDIERPRPARSAP